MLQNHKRIIILSFLLLLTLLSGSYKTNIDHIHHVSENNRLEWTSGAGYGYFVDNNGTIRADSLLYKEKEVLGSNLYKKVIECESNWRHYDENGNILVGDKHLPLQAYGIAQYQIRTFNWLKGLAGREYLCWTKEEDQIWLLKWAIENGYGYLWSCF